MSVGPELRADCARCAGLCCVALHFTRSADFPVDKPAGEPCENLGADFRCRIHPRLRERGFVGCVAFDCHGAGQQVTQVTFGGRDWRADPATGPAMFRAFGVMRRLHELLVHLHEALALPAASDLAPELRAASEALAERTRLGPDELLALDPWAVGRPVHELLLRAGERARSTSARGKGLGRRRDLVGADLRGRDLRGLELVGRAMIAADLRGADLRLADLRGADLRGADLRGADLTDALFLTTAQLASARGDAATRLSPSRARPDW